MHLLVRLVFLPCSAPPVRGTRSDVGFGGGIGPGYAGSQRAARCRHPTVRLQLEPCRRETEDASDSEVRGSNPDRGGILTGERARRFSERAGGARPKRVKVMKYVP